MNNKLLEVSDLCTYFYTDKGVVKAVDGVNFSLEKGKILGVVGESGCGKSMTALSIMGLVDEPGRVVNGSIVFEGNVLKTNDKEAMREVRGNDISMIFQEPMTSLNPVFRIGDQITEVIMLHQGVSEEEATKRAIELLDMVGIPRAGEVIRDYPHQLSGGMRQRVMIAMALACDPKILIADEPTTALDVTIQAQILELINKLKDKLDTAVILITHDLGVVANMADNVIVMYSGKVVEDAPVDQLFDNPLHPYTKGLLSSVPNLDEEQDYLDTIDGNVPNPLELPDGCYFYPRCKHACEKCLASKPELLEVEDGHRVSCFLYEEAWAHKGGVSHG